MPKPEKIWAEGEYETSKTLNAFLKWVGVAAIIALVLGIPLAVVLSNKDIF